MGPPWKERNDIIGLQWCQVRGRNAAAEGDGSSECVLRSNPEIGKSPAGLTLTNNVFIKLIVSGHSPINKSVYFTVSRGRPVISLMVEVTEVQAGFFSLLR